MKSLLSVFLLLASSAFAETSSVYSSIKFEDCVAVNASYLLPKGEAEIDYYEGVCPSFAGYQLGVAGGDLRYAVTLSYQGTEIELPILLQFHDTSELVEWRFTRTKTNEETNKVVFSSLIYRLNVSEYLESGEINNKSKLVVVRLNQEKSCVIGILDNQAQMNEKARSIADNNNAPCLQDFNN